MIRQKVDQVQKRMVQSQEDPAGQHREDTGKLSSRLSSPIERLEESNETILSFSSKERRMNIRKL